MMIETLEDRRLLSATILAHADCHGVLVVVGTNNADIIDIYEVDGQVTVVANQDAENPIFFGSASAVIVDSRGGKEKQR